MNRLLLCPGRGAQQHNNIPRIQHGISRRRARDPIVRVRQLGGLPWQTPTPDAGDPQPSFTRGLESVTGPETLSEADPGVLGALLGFLDGFGPIDPISAGDLEEALRSAHVQQRNAWRAVQPGARVPISAPAVLCGLIPLHRARRIMPMACVSHVACNDADGQHAFGTDLRDENGNPRANSVPNRENGIDLFPGLAANARIAYSGKAYVDLLKGNLTGATAGAPPLMALLAALAVLDSTQGKTPIKLPSGVIEPNQDLAKADDETKVCGSSFFCGVVPWSRLERRLSAMRRSGTPSSCCLQGRARCLSSAGRPRTRPPALPSCTFTSALMPRGLTQILSCTTSSSTTGPGASTQTRTWC